MTKNIILLLSILLISCGSNGIEGYVSEPITITAEKPDDGNDLDYFWALSNQPDGSLMNSNDLISVKDGNKMTFVPDYPGDYSIEVIISEYGDEISNQIFNFSILDFSEKKNEENLAIDGGGYLTYLATSRVNLQVIQDRWPDVIFKTVFWHLV